MICCNRSQTWINFWSAKVMKWVICSAFNLEIWEKSPVMNAASGLYQRSVKPAEDIRSYSSFATSKVRQLVLYEVWNEPSFIQKNCRQPPWHTWEKVASSKGYGVVRLLFRRDHRLFFFKNGVTLNGESFKNMLQELIWNLY